MAWQRMDRIPPGDRPRANHRVDTSGSNPPTLGIDRYMVDSTTVLSEITVRPTFEVVDHHRAPFSSPGTIANDAQQYPIVGGGCEVRSRSAIESPY